MNGKINNTLLGTLVAGSVPIEVNDTELKGFGLRVQTTGVMSYYVRYRIRGKQSRLVIGRTTEFTPAQARDAARNILASVNLGTDPVDSRKPVIAPKTLGEFMEQDYTPWATAHRKSAAPTIARIKHNFSEHWTKPLSELNAANIERWRLRRLTNAKRPAKPTTVNRDLAALKAALSRAVDWDFLPAHPLTRVKPSKVDSQGVVRYLTDPESKALFAALHQRDKDKRDERAQGNTWRRERGHPEMPTLVDQTYIDHLEPAVMLSLNTGIRRGELFSLLWTDVNLDKGHLSIRGSGAKSGKTRHVPLNSEVMTMLKQWRQQSSATNTLVFPGRDGKTLKDIKTAWRNLLETAGIKAFRWHDMRHDFASRLVTAGVDLNTVRELLGHSDLKMTLRYAHLAPEHKAAAVEKLIRTAA